jgi:hypothetical protein
MPEEKPQIDLRKWKHKFCIRCGYLRPLSEFRELPSGKPFPYCKVCESRIRELEDIFIYNAY